MSKLLIKDTISGIYTESEVDKYLIDNGYKLHTFGKNSHKELYELLLENGYNFKPCFPNRKPKELEKGISLHDVITHQLDTIEELDGDLYCITRILKDGYYIDSNECYFDEFIFLTKDNKIVSCSKSSSEMPLSETECLFNVFSDLEQEKNLEFFINLC